MKDAFRAAVLVLAGVNIGVIAAVWTISWERSPAHRAYVAFMSGWGIGLIILSTTITVNRLHSTHLSWHTPALAAIYAVGIYGFGLMLRRMRHATKGKGPWK